MDTLTGQSRRTLLTASALTAALALATEPAQAAPQCKQRGKKKPKPPIATCIAQLQSAATTGNPNSPEITTGWNVSGWDVRSTPAVAFNLGTVTSVISVGPRFQQDPAARIKEGLRRSVLNFALFESADKIDRIQILLI